MACKLLITLVAIKPTDVRRKDNEKDEIDCPGDCSGRRYVLGHWCHGSYSLENVKEKGHLQCGVTSGLPGFSQPDEKGNWTGIDVDTCRAVAAAIFGDANAVEFTPLTAKERFTALQSGEIDMLSRTLR